MGARQKLKVTSGGAAVPCGGTDIAQGMLVYIDTSGTDDVVAPTSGADDEPVGFAWQDYTEGDDVIVVAAGPAVGIASTAIDPGDAVTPASDGECAVDDGTTGEYVVGTAQTYAPGADAEVTVIAQAVKPANPA